MAVEPLAVARRAAGEGSCEARGEAAAGALPFARTACPGTIRRVGLPLRSDTWSEGVGVSIAAPPLWREEPGEASIAVGLSWLLPPLADGRRIAAGDDMALPLWHEAFCEAHGVEVAEAVADSFPSETRFCTAS